MKPLCWKSLSAVLLAVCVAVPQSVSSQARQGLLDDQGVDQGPPFPVPKAGYAVEGRPTLFVSHYDVVSVPWERFDGPGLPSGLQRRLLSHSSSMGAVSQITYVPAGWSHPAGYHTDDDEIFVLEGDLSIGDEKLTKYSYSYMPAGEIHGPVKSHQGAVLLEWWKGNPDFVASSHNKNGARDYARVRDWNRYKQPWYVAEPFPSYRTGGNFPGMIHTLLRKDPDTGEMTWLSFSASISAPPSSKPGNTFGVSYEVHPSFEEYFFPEKTNDTLIGECLEQGLTTVKYGNHTYWWRAGGVGHGGPASLSVGGAGYGIAIVRTGTRLWATYVTDCSYKTGFEYTSDGFKTYQYDRRPSVQK